MARYPRTLSSKMDATKYNQFINGQYFGDFRLTLGAGKYFDYDFAQSSAPANAVWKNQQGTYNQLSGYWIFRPDVRMCWQATPNGCGKLDYWNHDGYAQGNPEDWELFVFEGVDSGSAAVKVKNIYGCYVRYDPNSPLPYESSVRGTFLCDTNINSAQVFYVDFF
jgi:hypothetical protein